MLCFISNFSLPQEKIPHGKESPFSFFLHIEFQMKNTVQTADANGILWILIWSWICKCINLYSTL